MKRRWLYIGAALAVVAGLVVFRSSWHRGAPVVADRAPVRSRSPVPLPPVVDPIPASAVRPAGLDRLEQWVATLRGLPLRQRREQVAALLRELDRAEPADRSAAILAFLRSGQDVELPGDFSVGRGGWLSDWPSLRVALLDYLAQRDPAAAALIGREILEAPPRQGAAEWAIALRELARGQRCQEWSPLVARRVVDLLRNEAWSAAPSRAYLESFDLVVAGRAVAFLPELDRLLGAGSEATRFAGFLSADRLTLAVPAQVLGELNRQPQLFSSQPQCRAGLFARGDVRDPAQVAALENYLRRADVSAAEQELFAAAFPLYDLAVSDNLLTPPARRGLADMQAHDAAALRQMKIWQNDPSLSRCARLWPAVVARLQKQLQAARIP